MKTDKRCISELGLTTSNKTYVIAELGINHGGNINVAKNLIESAARTGADAVKFQTYITEQRAPDVNSVVFDILKKCELPFDSFEILKKHATNHGMNFFSTPFDAESVDCLEAIDCPVYKIASFDIVNLKLLSKIASTGKPVILSVGMASESEIRRAVQVLGNRMDKIAILHCVSAYPTPEDCANLNAISVLRDMFDCIIGHSDHTDDVRIPLYAVAMGATIIEKHYKIDNAMDCIDAQVSITEQQMTSMVSEIRKLEKIMGNGKLGVRKAEEPITVFRRYS